MFQDMPIISKYTRADMLADGELIDVSQMASEAGFKFPVAVVPTSVICSTCGVIRN